MMVSRLTDFLRCPACFGRYQFQEAKTEAIYRTSGVLSCSECGKSVITIRGIPLFCTLFEEASLAHNFLSLILREDPNVKPFLASVLGKSKKSFKLRELLNYIDNESLNRIFEHYRTGYIDLERFTWKKYHGIQGFLTSEPVETLLDIGCGFGCSSAPFLTSGKSNYCIGIDKNLFFLLLFQRYCQEQDFQNIDLVCFDTENQPFPFKSNLFDLVIGISFFNHFASTKTEKMINAFFGELDRITTGKGRAYIDAVPNRLNPFPGEVNLPGLLNLRLEQIAEIIGHIIPVKWLPRLLSMNILWHLYRGYCKSTNMKIEPYDVFLSYVSSAIPEVDVNHLPLFPSVYKILLARFTQTKVIPQNSFYKDFFLRKWTVLDFFKSTYLILYAQKILNTS